LEDKRMVPIWLSLILDLRNGQGCVVFLGDELEGFQRGETVPFLSEGVPAETEGSKGFTDLFRRLFRELEEDWRAIECFGFLREGGSPFLSPGLESVGTGRL
jgi:hypothetical protein